MHTPNASKYSTLLFDYRDKVFCAKMSHLVGLGPIHAGFIVLESHWSGQTMGFYRINNNDEETDGEPGERVYRSAEGNLHIHILPD